MTSSLRRILSSGAMTTESAMYIPSPTKEGHLLTQEETNKIEEKLAETLDKDSEAPQSPGIAGTIRNQVRRIWSSRTSTGDSDNKTLPQKDESIRSADNIEVSLEDTLANPDTSSPKISEEKPQTPQRLFKSNSIGPIQMTSLDDVIQELADDDNATQETRDDSAEDTHEVASAPDVLSPSVGQVAGNVTVVGLGFVTNMAEYMVAADILVSKAGPGTISEAAAVSLPVLLTSFLPGQEEGNVDFVVEGGFGTYCDDSDPQAIAEELSNWLQDESKLQELSEKAKAMGAPYAARNIVQQIGDSTLKWRELNEHHANPEAVIQKEKLKKQHK